MQNRNDNFEEIQMQDRFIQDSKLSPLCGENAKNSVLKSQKSLHNPPQSIIPKRISNLGSRRCVFRPHPNTDSGNIRTPS